MATPQKNKKQNKTKKTPIIQGSSKDTAEEQCSSAKYFILVHYKTADV